MFHFDLCLNWYWEHDGDFVHMVEKACALKGVSIYIVTPLNLLEATTTLLEGKMTIGALFDRGNDDLRFEPIRRFVKQNGIFFINPPEVAFEFEQKDKFHFILKENGIRVPETIVIPPFTEQPIIPVADLTPLGLPFVAKPAYAGGGAGVVLDLCTWEQVLHERMTVPAQWYLLQSYVHKQVFNKREAWFRIYYCAGKIYPCWWDTVTHAAAPVTTYEEAQFGLTPLRAMTREIARLCRLDLFSTEIALTPEGEFVAVDYVNDSIDLRAQSQAVDGVPDMVLWFIAHTLADFILHKREETKISRLDPGLLLDTEYSDVTEKTK